ncbi:AAA family ATPase [Sphingobium limneticum]|uniref:AAA family ATPase n=1 Tax=Sphingobium limneticum TaxID=1007511 RepID=UPI0031FC536D
MTGGPGSGKATIVDILAVRVSQHSSKAGRAIIRDQVAIGGTALPWADRAVYPLSEAE